MSLLVWRSAWWRYVWWRYMKMLASVVRIYWWLCWKMQNQIAFFEGVIQSEKKVDIHFLKRLVTFPDRIFLSKLCNLGQYTFTLLIRNKMVFIIANVILIVIRIKVIAFIVVLIILRMILMPTRCLSHVCSSSSEQYLVSILLLFFFFKFVSVKVWLNWIFSSLYCWSSIWFSWIHT